MIPITYLSLIEGLTNDSYWDLGLINDLLNDTRIKRVSELSSGGIIVFPARAQADKIKELNKYLNKLDWAILLLTGDEESVFPVEKIKHKNLRIYVMSPKEGRHDKYGKLLTGYPPQARVHLGKKYIKPTKDWFFSGQVTHSRREEMAQSLKELDNGYLVQTKSFTSGLNQPNYYKEMQQAKVLPAPSGPVTADTFRLAEALEAGRIPIADTVDQNSKDYWHYFFEGAAWFPTIKNYASLGSYIKDQLEDYTAKANKVYAGWQQYKRELKMSILGDVKTLTGKDLYYATTVVVPVSPIPSHPDTKILDETINSIRHHLPESEIFITFDGVREEQKHLKEKYQDFIHHALWKCNFKWNAVPYLFDEHTHQVGMLRAVIDKIKTPLILYVEQDTPLVIDREIDFKDCAQQIYQGAADLIRFHFESVIPKPHEHLMLGKRGDYIKTIQWSQRPHLTSKAYYRDVLSNFSDDAKCFIEDKMHGVVAEAHKIDGMVGWNRHKLCIYAPSDNLKYSYTTDGRQDQPKFDDTQEF